MDEQEQRGFRFAADQEQEEKKEFSFEREEENVKPQKFLNRDDILSTEDMRHKDVYVEEWGGWVRIRAITGKERDMYEQSLVEGRGRNQRMNMQNARAKLVALSAVDPETGKWVFKTKDIEELGKKNSRPLDTLFDVAMELSGLRQQDIEELTKNLSEGQSGDFTLD